MYQPGSSHRFNRRCKDCGAKFSVLATVAKNASGQYVYRGMDGTEYPPYRNDSYLLPYVCRGCGRTKLAKAVIGKYRSDKPCNDKCVAATGFTCECSCGGKNHGASHG